MNWLILNVEKNSEKKVVDILLRMNIDAFNPIDIGKKMSIYTQDTTELKVEKSFVFVKIEKKHRGIIFGIPHVLGYSFSNGKLTLTSEEEIKTMKDLSYPNYLPQQLITR